MHHDMILALFGATLAATMMGCGFLLGRRETLLTIDAQVIRDKAHLELQRAELTRITEGIRQGWMDSTGTPVKLLTNSKLKSMPLQELEVVARDRGLLTMQRLGEAISLIDAIEAQQRSWVQSGKLVGQSEPGKVINNPMDERIKHLSPENRQDLIDRGLLEED